MLFAIPVKNKCMKNAEKRLHNSSQQCMLKSPDMKLPADIVSFLKNGSNEENLFNFIETTFNQDKVKVGSKTMMFFSNTNHF